MVFSDDDLKRFKKIFENHGKIKALIARLEAAEDLASYAENPPVTIYERWTKAAGK